MAQGVYTRQKRITFVEKTIGEVGAGTYFPIEVTGAGLRDKFDKIAEVFHRASDAWIISGDMYFPSVDVTIHAATTASIPRTYSTVVGLRTRGYTTPSSGISGTIPDRFLPYLTDEYDIGSGDMYRDIGDNERGILMVAESGELPEWNVSGYVTNAFSYFNGGDPAVADALWFYSEQAGGASYYAAQGLAQVDGRVAYVLADPSDSIFSTDTRFFLYVYFEIAESGYSLFASTLETDFDTPACNYVMRLSSGDLSCPIYPSDYSASGFIPTGSDFIHEATEWFPYQDVGGNVWNPATGLPA